jgi:hypothetical protein
METSHRFHLYIVILMMFCGVLTSGCTPQLLSSGEQAPAELLGYPGAPPVHDGRVRFRQMVCDLAGQLPSGANTHFDCTHLLWRMADEKNHRPVHLPFPPMTRICIF